MATMSPAETVFCFVALQAAKREELGDLRRLNSSVKFRDGHFGAALERALKDTRDRQAPQEIAVIEIRYLNLQHARPDRLPAAESMSRFARREVRASSNRRRLCRCATPVFAFV